jgi:hypothetical protein
VFQFQLFAAKHGVGTDLFKTHDLYTPALKKGTELFKKVKKGTEQMLCPHYF